MLAQQYSNLEDDFKLFESSSAIEIASSGGVHLVQGQQWSQREGEAFLLLRNHYLGVCRSDAKESVGKRSGPSHFGHELVSEVVQVVGVNGYKRGDFVCINPNVQLNRSSGFSKYMIAAGDGKSISDAFFHLPCNVPSRRYVFAEPFACALHAVIQVSKVLPIKGLRVAIVGGGVSGILNGLGALHFGAASVALINKTRGRLAFVKSSLIGKRFSEFLTGEPDCYYDLIIITTAFITDETLIWALEHVNDGGGVLLYGGTDSNRKYLAINLDIDSIRRTEQIKRVRLSNKQLFMIGSYGTSRDAFLKAIDILSDESFANELESLIVKEEVLINIPRTFKDIIDGVFFGKVVVNFNMELNR
ncbi:MAG: alcohol dehydrogenase catalytic domain-containing protein [Formosimonas sp.]